MSRKAVRTRIHNLLTVDVEDYFHVSRCRYVVPREKWDALPQRARRNVHRALHLLAESNTHATFFVLGWVAERCPELVRDIQAGGHEVASHGCLHRLVSEQSAAEFREDVRKAKLLLEEITGSEVLGYRAPTYSIRNATFAVYDVLAEEGYRYDSSTFQSDENGMVGPGDGCGPYPVECADGRRVIEVPLASAAVGGLSIPISRGGYLRLLPITLLKSAIQRINSHGVPAVMSFHPWELDAHQPRMPLRLRDRICHYLNLHTTAAKVRALCSLFDFGRVCDHLGALL